MGSSCTPVEGREYLQKAIQFIAGLLAIAATALTALDAEEYKLTNTILTAVVAALNLFTSIFLSNIALTGESPAVATKANLTTRTGFTPGAGYEKVRGLM